LRDGERDYERLLEWVKRRGTPIAIRLVKGAYWDMETSIAVQNNTPPPVWTQKWESDACFERLTARMLENHRWIRPAFASHNVRSLAVVLARAEQLGLTSRHYEIQMLNGMGDPLKSAVVEMGQCLRIYTPYGELIPGMGYLIRRLLENTANDSFLRQDFSGGAAWRRLLIDPALAQPPSTQPRQVRFADIKEDEAMSTFRNEPNTNFGDQSNRTKYAQALAYVRKESGKEYPLVIGGQPVRTDSHFDSINPARPSEVVGKVALATPADADHAVAAARRALPGWREVHMTERAEVLRKAADIIRRRRFEMAATMTLEVGKPWREADADVAEALDYLVYYALQAERIGARPRRRDLPGEDNVLIYEPKGVCVVLSPWSFPLALLTNMTAAALVTGNTVVMKPSSHAAVIAAKLCEVFDQVGLPAGVLNYLPGPGDRIGSHLVRHPEVHVIAYTGSRQVGLEVLRAAADLGPAQQHIKKVIAEFGGKNAIIVDNDADLDEAVGGVVKSAFGYSGQKCTACSRVVVLKDVYDVFCQRLVDAVSSLTIGSPDEPGTIIGPVIDAQAQETMRRWIETGRTEGRVILERDATIVDGEGFYVAPTIIADVDPNASLAQHEIFGPVLLIIPADDFGHALEIANGTPYALTGGVYSRSPHNIEHTKREFLVGNLYINRKITGSRVDVQPFGGLKLSGDGAKAGGPDYLHEFCHARTITEHTLRHGLAPAQEVQTTV
ncbi:MAG: L-glutamate gamma-semialdehyde dehydrogenase, partial [Planctomycetes bacterium]|nr:L-glutamate gamma-semialdehyde dehydrogenase [Planctomycetota bacterium]